MITWKDMKDIEERERGNYTRKQFRSWEKKYKISDDDLVIWVTPNKNMAYTYDEPAGHREKILAMKDEELSELGEVSEYLSSEGILILESDDGDDGYLYVFHNTGKEEEKQ